MSSFFALDAQKGDLLWHFETGSGIDANPVAYMCEGKQYVAIAAGHALLVFGLDQVSVSRARRSLLSSVK